MRQETMEPADALVHEKVEHLFVLIGENPLPAYVAARTLLKPGGTLYPVYSQYTEKVFTALCATLASHGFGDGESGEIRRIAGVPLVADKYASLRLAEYDSHHIAREITRIVAKIKRENPTSTIGLNYTSGTGPMGVHSYMALRDWYRLPDPHTGQKPPGPEPIFSYLDPRTPRMLVDKAQGRPEAYPITLKINVDELILLHGLRQKETEGDSILPDAASKLAKMFSSSQKALKSWTGWCATVLDRECRAMIDGRREWKSEADLAEIALPLTRPNPSSYSDGDPSTQALHDSALTFLREEYGVVGDTLPLRALAEVGGFSSLQTGCAWLHGRWLESYVLAQVNALADSLPPSAAIHSARQSIVILRDASEKERFEFDVAFVIGYQLFAISCTTSRERSRCKSKLLEAYVRARQLGGGEARTALVCMLSDILPSDDQDAGGVQELEKELKLVLDDTRIAVFGRSHLMSLPLRLREWVNANSSGSVDAP